MPFDAFWMIVAGVLHTPARWLNPLHISRVLRLTCPHRE
jgi:hypothetical protein